MRNLTDFLELGRVNANQILEIEMIDMFPDDFLVTRLSYGIILRADLGTIEEIKTFISELEGVDVAYQTVSGDKLWIVPKEKNERGQR